ncbi:hypothetical protein ONZ45_g1248 [Pleurotus djamor]|nr:hypothetical protein ONZ45_g1248 [Pleurotus djamor]
MPNDPQTIHEIDDTDASVAYTTNWVRQGSCNEHNHTAHFTNTTGAYFSLTFTGTSIKVFGTTNPVAQNIQHSYYAIDGSFSSTYIQQNSTITQGDQLFFSVDGLTNGTHALVGTCAGGSIWLDYFQVGTANPISSGTVESLPSPSIPGHPNLSTATLLHDTPTSVAGATSPSNGDASAIAGASVSGVVFIVVIFVLVWCFRRYRHLTSSPSPLHDDDDINLGNLGSEESSTSSIPTREGSPSLSPPTSRRVSSSLSNADADASTSPTYVQVSGNTNQVSAVRSRNKASLRPSHGNARSLILMTIPIYSVDPG